MEPTSVMPRILIVDDEQGYRSLLLWKLGARGLTVDTVSDGQEALRLFREKAYDLVITDLTLPHGGGLKVLEEVKRISPTTEVIIMTGFGTVETAVGAMKLGAFDVVIKPFDLEPFIMTALSALEKRRRALAA